jgi:hypothetical protein
MDEKNTPAGGQPPAGLPNFQMPSDLAPIYANLVRISHTPAEIVLDFSRILPAQPVMTVLARIVMSPVAAKLFYRALGENLAHYEAVFGNIPTPGVTLADDLFRSIHPPEPPKE